MATDSRPKKILAEIKEKIADEDHAAKVISAFAPYDMARKRMLFTTMTDTLKGGIASQKAEVADKWKTALEKALERMGKGVTRIAEVKKDRPEDERKTEIKIAKEEAKFIQAAGKLMGIGAKVDVVIKLGLDLTKKSNELLEVWNNLEDDFQDAENAMSDAQQDVERTVNDAITAIAANERTAFEYAMDVAEFLENSPPDVEPIPGLEGLGALTKWIASVRRTAALQLEAQRRVVDREVRLKLQIAKRGVGVVVFAELRDAVKEFLDEVNVEKSSLAVKEAKALIKGALDGCTIAEQKSDMTEFTSWLLALIEDAHEKTVSAHDKFVAANADIFFGAVSNDTMRVLLNRERWQKRFYGVRISKLNSALQKVYNFEYLEVPLRGYKGDMEYAVQDYLRRAVGEHYIAMQKADRNWLDTKSRFDDFVDDMERLDREVD